MGHVLGAEKGNFLIRGRGRPTVYGGRAGLILSIPAQEVSLGSPRVGTRHAHAPTPYTPPLQAFLVEFSWWFFAILATLCLVAWTLMDLRSKPPARR